MDQGRRRVPRSALSAMSPGHAGGMTAISRWLSEATPPVVVQFPLHPGRDASTGAMAATPAGVVLVEGTGPEVSLRSTSG
jgi:hypothetical protein